MDIPFSQAYKVLLEEIEQEIKTGLNITPVTNMEEVLQHSFQKGSKDDY